VRSLEHEGANVPPGVDLNRIAEIVARERERADHGVQIGKRDRSVVGREYLEEGQEHGRGCIVPSRRAGGSAAITGATLDTSCPTASRSKIGQCGVSFSSFQHLLILVYPMSSSSLFKPAHTGRQNEYGKHLTKPEPTLTKAEEVCGSTFAHTRKRGLPVY
jgi:hypothetical protein